MQAHALVPSENWDDDFEFQGSSTTNSPVKRNSRKGKDRQQQQHYDANRTERMSIASSQWTEEDWDIRSTASPAPSLNHRFGANALASSSSLANANYSPNGNAMSTTTTTATNNNSPPRRAPVYNRKRSGSFDRTHKSNASKSSIPPGLAQWVEEDGDGFGDNDDLDGFGLGGGSDNVVVFNEGLSSASKRLFADVGNLPGTSGSGKGGLEVETENWDDDFEDPSPTRATMDTVSSRVQQDSLATPVQHESWDEEFGLGPPPPSRRKKRSSEPAPQSHSNLSSDEDDDAEFGFFDNDREEDRTVTARSRRVALARLSPSRAHPNSSSSTSPPPPVPAIPSPFLSPQPVAIPSQPSSSSPHPFPAPHSPTSSVFSVPTTLNDARSYTSTTHLHPTASRTSSGHGHAGLANVPPSPRRPKSRERRRLRKKSRPVPANQYEMSNLSGYSHHHHQQHPYGGGKYPYQYAYSFSDGELEEIRDTDDGDLDGDERVFRREGMRTPSPHPPYSGHHHPMSVPVTPSRSSSASHSHSHSQYHGHDQNPNSSNTAGSGVAPVVPVPVPATPSSKAGALLSRIGSVTRKGWVRRKRGSSVSAAVGGSGTAALGASDTAEAPASNKHLLNLELEEQRQQQLTPRPRSSLSSLQHQQRERERQLQVSPMNRPATSASHHHQRQHHPGVSPSIHSSMSPAHPDVSPSGHSSISHGHPSTSPNANHHYPSTSPNTTTTNPPQSNSWFFRSTSNSTTHSNMTSSSAYTTSSTATTANTHATRESYVSRETYASGGTYASRDTYASGGTHVSRETYGSRETGGSSLAGYRAGESRSGSMSDLSLREPGGGRYTPSLGGVDAFDAHHHQEGTTSTGRTMTPSTPSKLIKRKSLGFVQLRRVRGDKDRDRDKDKGREKERDKEREGEGSSGSDVFSPPSTSSTSTHPQPFARRHPSTSKRPVSIAGPSPNRPSGPPSSGGLPGYAGGIDGGGGAGSGSDSRSGSGRRPGGGGGQPRHASYGHASGMRERKRSGLVAVFGGGGRGKDGGSKASVVGVFGAEGEGGGGGLEDRSGEFEGGRGRGKDGDREKDKEKEKEKGTLASGMRAFMGNVRRLSIVGGGRSSDSANANPGHSNAFSSSPVHAGKEGKSPMGHQRTKSGGPSPSPGYGYKGLVDSIGRGSTSSTSLSRPGSSTSQHTQHTGHSHHVHHTGHGHAQHTQGHGRPLTPSTSYPHLASAVGLSGLGGVGRRSLSRSGSGRRSVSGSREGGAASGSGTTGRRKSGEGVRGEGRKSSEGRKSGEGSKSSEVAARIDEHGSRHVSGSSVSSVPMPSSRSRSRARSRSKSKSRSRSKSRSASSSSTSLHRDGDDSDDDDEDDEENEEADESITTRTARSRQASLLDENQKTPRASKIQSYGYAYGLKTPDNRPPVPLLPAIELHLHPPSPPRGSQDRERGEREGVGVVGEGASRSRYQSMSGGLAPGVEELGGSPGGRGTMVSPPHPSGHPGSPHHQNQQNQRPASPHHQHPSSPHHHTASPHHQRHPASPHHKNQAQYSPHHQNQYQNRQPTTPMSTKSLSPILSVGSQGGGGSPRTVREGLGDVGRSLDFGACGDGSSPDATNATANSPLGASSSPKVPPSGNGGSTASPSAANTERSARRPIRPPASPGQLQSASLGRSVGSPVASSTSALASSGASGSGATSRGNGNGGGGGGASGNGNGKGGANGEGGGGAAVPRRNSLGDLKIPARISQAQSSLRRDLGMVREFAGHVEHMKTLQTTYDTLVAEVQAVLERQAAGWYHAQQQQQQQARDAEQSEEQPRAISPSFFNNLVGSARSGGLKVRKRSNTNPDQAQPPQPTQPILSAQDQANKAAYKDLATAFYTINSKYRISWECAELLVELGSTGASGGGGGGSATTSPSRGGSVGRNAGFGMASAVGGAGHMVGGDGGRSASPNAGVMGGGTGGRASLGQSLAAASASTTAVGLVGGHEVKGKRSRERAITLAGDESRPSTPSGLVAMAGAQPPHSHSQPQIYSPNSQGSQHHPPTASPPLWRASTGRHDLSHRQLALLKEMLNNSEPVAATASPPPASSIPEEPLSSASPFGSPTSHGVGMGLLASPSSGGGIMMPFSSPSSATGPAGSTLNVNRDWRWGNDPMASTVTLPSEEESIATGENNQGGEVSGANGASGSKKRKTGKLNMSGFRDMLRALRRGGGVIDTSLAMVNAQQQQQHGGQQPDGGVYTSSAPMSMAASTTSLAMESSADGHGRVGRSPTLQRDGRGEKKRPRSSVGGREPSIGPEFSEQQLYTGHKIPPKSPRRPSLASIFRIGIGGKSRSGGGGGGGSVTASDGGLAGSVPESSASSRVPSGSSHSGAESSSVPGSGRPSRDFGRQDGVDGDEDDDEEEDWDQIDSASDLDGHPDHHLHQHGHQLQHGGKPYGGLSPTGVEGSATIRATSTSRGRKLRKPNSPYLQQDPYAARSTSGLSTGGGRRSASASQVSLNLSASDSSSVAGTSGNALSGSRAGPASSVTALSTPRPIRLSNVQESQAESPVWPMRTSSLAHGVKPGPTNRSVSGSSGKFHTTGKVASGSLRAGPPQPITVPSNSSSSPQPRPHSQVPPTPTLALTPENIRPLLENAREVQMRLNQCIAEVQALLERAKEVPVPGENKEASQSRVSVVEEVGVGVAS
ncbi:hypothetical protein CC1G_15763 [Coprinopsis cinerea okayama7|uniref:Uncharacterized protein n=1 Tax=Coprinopsis cinerea (strain Okayama-7 / 130 / ATCC MYA-4618 / FGSC 9003) TaxID=240176 RepID=D6RQX7_COPC7|nr:hypothetical protein CC1G_15763 [Coprinopsis cinerea okayama7\|eukprot:XP_002910044.1 hypothetical protein CC1G_15763 [Coprinopsis cinerea okayama7\